MIDWLTGSCNAHATSRYFEPHVVKFFAMELVLAIGHLHKQDIGKIYLRKKEPLHKNREEHGGEPHALVCLALDVFLK
jgi:hypothetical protein